MTENDHPKGALLFMFADALLEEAKRATGVRGVNGKALFEDVGDAVGVELVKVGRRFIYRTRRRP